MNSLFSKATFLFAVAAISSCTALSLEKEFGNNELYMDLSDPYYFSAGMYFSLTKNPIPALPPIGEKALYQYLLGNTFNPNCFVVEIGTFPLPLVGAAAKSWAPTYYNRATIGKANIINAITESVNFKEPWSLSVFAGHMAFFKGQNNEMDGHANIGMLASYGYYHIKDNSLFPDHWGEFELKIKVDKEGTDRQYATSYRIGTRIHSDIDIKDLFYISLKRDRTDFLENGFSLIKNTEFQARVDFSYLPLSTLSFSVLAGKKYPFKVQKKTYILGISFGITWHMNNPYNNDIGKDFVPNSISPIIAPVLKF